MHGEVFRGAPRVWLEIIPLPGRKWKFVCLKSVIRIDLIPVRVGVVQLLIKW